MTDTKGKVVAVNGNMVSVEFDGKVSLNEVGYVKVDGQSLKGEVIRIRGNTAQMQILSFFGSTTKIASGMFFISLIPPRFFSSFSHSFLRAITSFFGSTSSSL